MGEHRSLWSRLTTGTTEPRPQEAEDLWQPAEWPGIREGATENATVVSALLSELVERGLDFSTPRLYILDGGKALHAAVRRHAGEAAFIQRCQVHKKAQRGGSPGALRTYIALAADTKRLIRNGRVAHNGGAK